MGAITLYRSVIEFFLLVMGEVSVLTSQTCYIIPPVMPSARSVTATPITIALRETPRYF